MIFSSPFKVIKEKHFPFPSEVLWDLLSNTEHLNRMIGLPAVTYGRVESSSSGIFRWAQARVSPFGLLKWKEYPFEWIKPQTYRVRRVFENGPFREVYGGIDVVSLHPGSQLRVVAEFTPRHLWGRLLSYPVAHKAVADTLAYCARAVVEDESGSRLEAPLPSNISTNQEHLKSAQMRLEQLATSSPELIQRLIFFLKTRSDEEVIGMRPYVLADCWQLDRREVLRLFLFATRAGLLELQWQLMCHVCRVPQASYSTLSSLSPQFHCDFCGVNYTADLDQSTEIRFNICPTIRPAQKQIYCIGGPVNTPHILCQILFGPGETRITSLPLPAEAKQFRLRVLQTTHVVTLDPTTQANAPYQLECSYDGANWKTSSYLISRGLLQVKINNTCTYPIAVVFENISPDTRAVTAAEVTQLREFRAHFSSEVLSPGREMAVRRVCIMFTDLKSSTSLYENLGDAPALGRVHRHFDFLNEIIHRNQGITVKTMGDAVMAVFSYASDAMRAALAIQTEVHLFNQNNYFDPPFIIKIGLHQGPALVATANNSLDYFGRTINLASRIENQSEGGDIVCPEELLREPGVKEICEHHTLETEIVSPRLAGIAEPILLYRLILKT